MPDVDIRSEGAVGCVTLGRPEALNALSAEMGVAIETALDAWRDDPAIKVVIFEADGEKAFCAGGVKPTFTVRSQMALLHKWVEVCSSPFPGRTYPTGSVTGMPRAV